MAASVSSSGPGILFVKSSITRPDLLTEDAFTNWYENDHIREILSLGFHRSAFRWKCTKTESGNQTHTYLASYPMDDVKVLQSRAFKELGMSSPLSGNARSCFDLIDFKSGCYELVQVYDPTRKGPGHVKSIVTAEVDFEDEKAEKAADKWFRAEPLAALQARMPGYLRSTRFQMLFSRSNADMRRLRSKTPVDMEKPSEPMSRWLAIHEFELPPEEVSIEKLQAVTSSPWKDKVQEQVVKMEVNQWSLVKVFGDKQWFHGEDYQDF